MSSSAAASSFFPPEDAKGVVVKMIRKEKLTSLSRISRRSGLRRHYSSADLLKKRGNGISTTSSLSMAERSRPRIHKSVSLGSSKNQQQLEQLKQATTPNNHMWDNNKNKKENTAVPAATSDSAAVVVNRRKGGLRRHYSAANIYKHDDNNDNVFSSNNPELQNEEECQPPVLRKSVSFGSSRTYEIQSMKAQLLEGRNISSNSNSSSTSSKNNKNSKTKNNEIESQQQKKKVQQLIKNEIWYSKVEISTMAQKSLGIALDADMKGVSHFDIQNTKSKKSIRGLERLLPNDMLTKKRAKFQTQSRNAVLSEQQRQKELGIYDPMLIMTMYKANGAKHSSIVAKDLGLHDETIAVKQNNEDSKKKSLFTKLLLM